jgi:RNA polymerase sigma factor (sigma-70 family)
VVVELDSNNVTNRTIFIWFRHFALGDLSTSRYLYHSNHVSFPAIPSGDFAMTADFTLAIQFAQISAKRCARRYNLDLDVCLSEAYLAISSRLPKFDPQKTQLSTYVYRVVTNQIIDYLRSECLTARAKQTQRLQDDADFGCSSSFQDDDADIAARLALTFAEGGSQARTIRRKVESELQDRGWSSTRIEDAFAAVADGLSTSSFVHS